jgi:hypothetical protein
MTDSPILHIPQVAANQINKEVTLNSAIAILERSLNDKVIVDMTAGDVTLNITDYTRFMIAFCSGHTVARVLTVPASKRFFMVKNSGTGVVTVDCGGVTQDVDPGSYDGFINDGTDIHKLFDSAAATAITTFLGLSDTPNLYTGQAGKVPTVNGGETALVFSTPVIGATQLDDLTDVDLTTNAPTSKQILMFDSASNTWLPFTMGKLKTYASSSTLVLADAYAWVQGNNASAMNLTVPPNSSVAYPIGAMIFVENFGAGLVTMVAGGGVTIHSKDGLTFTTQYQIGVLKKVGTDVWNFALVGSAAAGVTAFTGLSDVPASFTGASLKKLRVNVGETALEFVDDILVNTYTADTTLSISDEEAIVAMNKASAVNLTVPPNASVAFEIGAKILVWNKGAGLTTIVAGAGVTVHGTLTMTAQYRIGLLIKVGTNEWSFVEFGSGGVTAFTGLSDVPASYSGSALKALRVNAGATAVEFYTPSAGVTAFTGLSDVPASYTGQTLKGVRVNAGETALEFFTRNMDSMTDVDTTTNAPSAGDILRFDGTNWVRKTPRHTVGMFISGVPTISIMVLQYVAPFAFHLPISLTGSSGYAVTAPSGGSVDYDLRKNGVSIGTISFASGSNTPTFTFSSATAFAAGDRLSIHSPANVRSMADVSVTLNGTED